MAKKTTKKKTVSRAKRAAQKAEDAAKACRHVERAWDELSRAETLLKRIGAKRAAAHAKAARQRMDALIKACY